MRRNLLTLIAILSLATSFAQLPPGSTAPNFIATDINGQTHNLYTDYLDQDKAVFLDFFATWCGPCWNYHQTHAFENLYTTYGPNGTDEVMTFSIESDATTTLSDIYGTGPNTIGNWTAGISYPIIDDASIAPLYNVNYYPTIYGICPDRTVEEVGQVGMNQLYAFAQACPPVPPISNIVNVVNVNCFGQATGAINISVTGGIPPYTYQWSNGMSSQNISNVIADTYYCTVTGANGGTDELGPIIISQPSTPVSLNVGNIQHAGCNGVPGQATVFAFGGTGTHTYLWSTGQAGPTAYGLPAGTYSVTAYDGNGCTDMIPNIVIDPPLIPTAEAGPTGIITCDESELILNGAGSSIGPTIVYQWSTGDGNIVSGENTLTPEIDAAGTYTIVVIDGLTTCESHDQVIIDEDTEAPDADAGDEEIVDCNNEIVELNGSGSSGNNIAYLWETDDGNIISGENTLTPEVDEAGTYTLTVTNEDNGCESDSSTVVTADFAIPDASADGDEIDCNNPEVSLDGNSQTENVTFEWDGPNNFYSQEEDPLVDESGLYTLTVTGENGCTATEDAEVTEDTESPDAEALGGTLTCIITSVTLEGNSESENVTYDWEGPNGFSSSEQNPEVDETGLYTLTVTSENGCTSQDETDVLEDTAAPTADAGEDEKLNCNNPSVFLDGSNSSGGSAFTYSWTTDDGNILNGESSLTPEVDGVGNYLLTVTNTINGCTETSEAEVNQTPEVGADINNHINVDCYGNSNGEAGVEATGGDGNYNYEWSNGETTTEITGLVAGTYGVTVTDGEGCTSSESLEITQPNELAVNATATGETSNGGNDGTASANPSGGTAPFIYEWSNGDTRKTIDQLVPGNYSVTVTDANNCETSESITVNSFNCTIAGTPDGTDISCNGANDGEATIDLQNAANPVAYEWDNGETTAIISNLAPGTYSVTATDDNNCPITGSVTISEPQILAVNATSTNETMASANDGTATAEPTGGVGTYAYNWSNGETTQTIEGLSPGEYTVTITDENNCTEHQSINVAPFGCTINGTISSANISCKGAADGTATINLSGGTAPFNYEWSNGASTATIENLTAGIYSVIVLDDNNCPVEHEVTIEEPEEIITHIESITPAECEDGENGEATVSAEGGTGQISYEWSNGASGPTASNLAPNNYLVTISDENNCTETLEVTIEAEDNELPTVITQDISLGLNSNGQVLLTPEMVDDGSFDNCEIESMNINVSGFDCDGIGTHEVTLDILDVNGNSNTGIAMVTVVDDMAPNVQVQNVSITLDVNGEASITTGMINDGSTDNCGIENMTLSQTNFNCDHVGDNQVILSVRDVNDNVGTATAIVTVVENVAPIAIAKSITVSLDDNGNALVLPADIDNGSSDNCGIAMMALNQQNFDCSNIGDNNVTLTVTDGSGNNSSAIAVVTIVDDIAPIISCTGDIQATTCDNVVVYDQPMVLDNCDSGNLELISGLESGEVFPVGVTTVTWQYTDQGGNSIQCAFTVTANELLIIGEIQSEPVSCYGAEDGSISAFPNGGTPGYSYLWSDGQTTQTASNLMAGTYEVTAIDANGCEATSTIEVSEPQEILIAVDNVEGDVNMTNSGSIEISVSGGEAPYNYSWSLNGNVISNEEDPTNLPAGDYLVEITDDNGCLIVSNVITVESITGVVEPDWAKDLILTPNPTSGKLYLQLPNLSDNALVEVFEITGKVIEVQIEDFGNSFQFDLGDTANGMYLIQVTVAEESITRRVVVNH